ncbi:hypothetical protein SYNTR_1862 [Candidatus Syntrophocurvum alkaliphilum]|uniref:SLH domain-containing protein n=1 Tax=Candidatus Syntrophocurvum alkaliphilum TaxID=2293317 RepID=A0A6I6DEC7_9FIRM|nr:S-layer homology domain-containing protein [Candidatus Syntrophocurvum alkaliphilum]QGU00456.1 hypothetical protein SYNTR_1862 [Candidatus Syntrophocurvum alkaliphilum]
MKRLISILTTGLFLLCFVLPSNVLAFDDIRGHWAEHDILRMNAVGIIEGDGEGYFFPNVSLSRQETLAMILRLVGLDDEADTANVPSSSTTFSPNNAAEWAKGYLYVSMQEGIIDSSDVRISNWRGPVERQEVAIWLSKALKLPPVSNYHSSLVQFEDGGQIAVQKAPYIAPLINDRVIVGADGYFKPRDAIMRGEMAALLNRVDGRYTERSTISPPSYGQDPFFGGLPTDGIYDPAPSTPSNTVYLTGEFYDIDFENDTLEIIKRGNYLKLDLATNYLSQFGVNYSWQLPYRFGDDVEVQLINGYVTYIDVIDRYDRDRDDYRDGDIVVYKGDISSVDSSRDRIELRSGSVEYIDGTRWRSESGSKTMDVASRADIYKDERDISLRSLRRGDTVYVAYDEHRREAVQIRTRDGSETTESSDIRTLNTSRQTFSLSNSTRTYDYDDCAIVVHNGELLDIDDLRRDDDVYLVADRINWPSDFNAAVVIIDPRRSDRGYGDDYIVYRAELDDVYTRSDEIRLTDVDYWSGSRWRSQSSRETLYVERRAEIYCCGSEIDLYDLSDDHIDDTVYVLYDEYNDEVVKIRVLEDSRRFISNEEVYEVNRSDFRLDNRNRDRIRFDDCTIVMLGDRWVDIDDLLEGDIVYVEVDRVNGIDYAAVIFID